MKGDNPHEIHGAGVVLYFEFFKQLLAIFALLTVVSLPMMHIYSSYGGMHFKTDLAFSA